MEARGRKCRVPASPERTKIWVEPNSKNHANSQRGKKVPVVYYLCKNRHLEHPHFIEVPLSSAEGLYLRDVINRLNVLRGKSMASMYSWSCKRSYKNGFVWHDLSDDDLVLPSHGNEYVLKGSELLDQSPQERPNQNSRNSKSEKLKSPQIDSPKSNDASSSSSSPPPIKEEKKSVPVQYEEQYNTGTNTPHSISSGTSSPTLTEYKIIKPIIAQDASTQTEERKTRTVPNPSSPSASSSGTGIGTDIGTGKIDTLESLIRAEASKRTNYRVSGGDESFAPIEERLKPSNLLIQLITCGAISAKDHRGFGFVPTYRPRFTQLGFPSPVPVYGTGTGVIRSVDRLSESSRSAGFKVEDADIFSERKKVKEDHIGTGLKKSDSFDDETHERVSKLDDEYEPNSSIATKCLPQTIKMISCKYPRGEFVKSPQGPNCDNKSSPAFSSKAAGKITVLSDSYSSSVVGSTSKRFESCKANKEKITKIEESFLQELRL